MKTLILALAVGVALAYPAAAYADEITNIFEDLFNASDHSHRDHDERLTRHQATRSSPAEPTG